MALPVQSIRAHPDHRGTLQAVANYLRTEGGNDRLSAFLADPRSAPVGPYRNEQAALDFLVTRLIGGVKPAEVWLFGSRGRRLRGLDANVRADSDFDFLVVLPPGLPENAYNDYELVSAPVTLCGVGVDVLPIDEASFQALQNDPMSICHTIANEGVRLYQKRVL